MWKKNHYTTRHSILRYMAEVLITIHGLKKIDLENGHIKRTGIAKYLGVMVYECLNFKDHITFIKPKLAKNVGILDSSIQKVNKMLYFSLIHPYLLYCYSLVVDVHQPFISALCFTK